MSHRQRFWYGFGFECCPSFEGSNVLEVGSGLGERCIEIGQNGANSVLGIDLFAPSIESANDLMKKDFPQFSKVIKFYHGAIQSVERKDFDFIISEHTFEHVIGVDEMLEEMRARMKPGALALIGFDPLYHSPYGDHGWMRSMLPFNRWFSWPWGHLLFPNYIFQRLSHKFGREITRTQDWPYLDLNQLTINDFRRLFQDSGLSVERLRTNVVYSRKSKLFAVIAKHHYLEKYFTTNVYCILRRDF